jgi:alkanesulfonate monooxygenase SsuD/methylene tetrahydromethanopterin reductase-like flavin-dependent oxidoreductase (luciferase family)
MRVGFGLALLNDGTIPDADLYREAIRRAEQAERLGFDSLWTVEHHFTGHSPVPNPLQLLAYIAARTSRIRLGTAVIVLPWHDPVRVAEEIAMLATLAPGRAVFGFGRGAAPAEFHGFRVPVEESRARFTEALEIVALALSHERFSYEGEIFSIPEISIRPRPAAPPPLYGAVGSDASAVAIGERGLGPLIAPSPDLDETAGHLDSYREAAVRAGHEPRPPASHMYVCLGETEAEAGEAGRRWVAPMLDVLRRHYEGFGPAAPAPGGQLPRGDDASAAFVERHVVGTPEAAVERIAEIRRRTGLGEFVAELAFAGMTPADADRNALLFAERVLPALRREEALL